jgi:hypothetical protein
MLSVVDCTRTEIVLDDRLLMLVMEVAHGGTRSTALAILIILGGQKTT